MNRHSLPNPSDRTKAQLPAVVPHPSDAKDLAPPDMPAKKE